MIKLYILSIIFCLGCMYFAINYVSDMVDKLNINRNLNAENRHKGTVSLIVMSVTPVLNIIIGLSCIMLFMGKLDDTIIDKLNKK